MQPFLEIPISIANVKGEEKLTTCRMKPGNIDYYYPGFHEGTVIVLKSGQAILSTLTYKEFDDALNAYKAFIDKSPGVFGNLQIKTKPSPLKPIIHAVD
jgi:hypothetical protein